MLNRKFILLIMILLAVFSFMIIPGVGAHQDQPALELESDILFGIDFDIPSFQLVYQIPGKDFGSLFWQTSQNLSCICGMHSDQRISVIGIDLNKGNTMKSAASIIKPIGINRVLKCPSG